MLIDIPDDITARVEQEARRSGRSMRDVLAGILRRALGLAATEEALPARDESSEDTLSGTSSASACPSVDEALAARERLRGDLDEEEAVELASREVRAYRRERMRKTS